MQRDQELKQAGMDADSFKIEKERRQMQQGIEAVRRSVARERHIEKQEALKALARPKSPAGGPLGVVPFAYVRVAAPMMLTKRRLRRHRKKLGLS